MHNEPITFEEPQRQSALGVLVLMVINAQNLLKTAWPFIIYLFIRGGTEFSLFSIGIVAFFLFILIKAFLKYWFFTFYIDTSHKEFIIQEGVFSKTTINIPFEKIQQVNLTQNIIHKLLKIYKVDIDTAGSSGNEVAINALSSELAHVLKAKLQEEAKSNIEYSKPEEHVTNNAFTFKIPFKTLVKVGLTSKYRESISLFIVAIFYIYDNASKFENETFIDSNTVENYVSLFSTSLSIFIGFFIILALLLSINLIRTIVSFYDFKVEKEKDSLFFKFGLLKTREVFLKPSKVQVFIKRQNWLQKKLDISELYMEQARSGEAASNTKQKLQIPGVNQFEFSLLQNLIYNKNPKETTVLFPNIRKWLLPCLVLSFITNTVVFILNYYNIIQTALYFIIPVTLIIVYLTYLGYKNSKLIMDDSFIQYQHGIWDIDTKIIENYKIQGIKTHQFFWQKRFDVGSVTLFTAGGAISINTFKMSELQQYANYWLYCSEVSNKKWM